MKNLIVFLSALFLTCCTQMCGDARDDMSPEQVVEAYLDISLNMTDPSEKEQLLDLTTGELKSAINSASAETMINAFVKKHYRLKTYSVIERRDRTPRETEITFLLIYNDLGDNPEAKIEEAPEISTENTVAVIKERGVWYLKDVIGKRTSIDFPVAGEVIKPGSGGGEPDPVEEAEKNDEESVQVEGSNP